MKRPSMTHEEKAALMDDTASIHEADEAARALAARVKTDRELDLIEEIRTALATLYRRRLALQHSRYKNPPPLPDEAWPEPHEDDWSDGNCIRTADHALRVLAVVERRSKIELDEITRGRRALARIAARLKA